MFTCYMYFFCACPFGGIVHVVGDEKDWPVNETFSLSILQTLIGIIVVCDEYFGSIVEGIIWYRNTSLLMLD